MSILDYNPRGVQRSESESMDSDDPDKRSKSRAHSSTPEQCKKIQEMLSQELLTHPYTRDHWDNLAQKVRESLTEVAQEEVYAKMLPIEALFLRWLVEEALPERELNFSEFARRVYVKRHQVVRTILPKVIRAYAMHIDRAVFFFLLATNMPE